jgi:hypothetical protein
MKRSAALLGAFVLAALLLAPAATADRPLRSFLPTDDLVLSGICPFDVGVDILVNNEFGTLFSDGRFLITGSLKVQITNLDEPTNSLTANVSGPGVFTPTADGGTVLKAEGRWFFFFFPGDLGPGSPGVAVITAGLSTLVISGTGELTFTPARNVTDLCAALA